jgi:hypothetical protein
LEESLVKLEYPNGCSFTRLVLCSN